MTSKRHVVLASAAPRTTCGEETVHDGDTHKKPKFATTTARKVPLEFSAPEEIWHHLTRPRHLPRIPGIPRLPVRKIAATAVALIPKRVKASRTVQLARRHPGFAGWVLIFAGAAASIAGLQFVEPHYRSEPGAIPEVARTARHTGGRRNARGDRPIDKYPFRAGRTFRRTLRGLLHLC